MAMSGARLWVLLFMLCKHQQLLAVPTSSVHTASEVVRNGDHGAPTSTTSSQNNHKAFPLLLPEATHTKLKLQQAGLDYLRSIPHPVALVIVAGPYRSGKSFLLNQLLRLPCRRNIVFSCSRGRQALRILPHVGFHIIIYYHILTPLLCAAALALVSDINATP